MLSSREGQSAFLDKLVETEVSKEAGVKKTASDNAGINAGTPSIEADVKTAKTNHPAEKAAAEADKIKKVAIDKEAADKATADKIAADKAAADKAATDKAAADKTATTDKEVAKGMTLHQARVARRTGKFVKVAGRNDMYQEAATGNYWKITGSQVVREFNEKNGVIEQK